MNQFEILNLLKEYNLESRSERINTDAYKITTNRDRLIISFTIVINILEFHFQASDEKLQITIDDWFDYYGDMAVQDHLEDLKRFLDVMENKSIRITKDRKTVEYKEQKWKYFFGKYIEG